MVLDPRRVTTQTEPTPSRLSAFSIGPTALGTGAADIIAAVTGRDILVRHFVAANITAGAVTITLYLVPPSGTAADANALCKGFSIDANKTVVLDFIGADGVGILIEPGYKLQGLASAATSINVAGWGHLSSGSSE